LRLIAIFPAKTRDQAAQHEGDEQRGQRSLSHHITQKRERLARRLPFFQLSCCDCASSLRAAPDPPFPAPSIWAIDRRRNRSYCERFGRTGALATKGTRGRSERTDNDRSRMVMAQDPPEPKRDGKGATSRALASLHGKFRSPSPSARRKPITAQCPI
jgi:hypothetical protein